MTKPAIRSRSVITRSEQAAQALKVYAEWCGGIHDDRCPADDTCDCSGKWINDGVTEAVNLLEGDLRTLVRGQEVQIECPWCQQPVQTHACTKGHRLKDGRTWCPGSGASPVEREAKADSNRQYRPSADLPGGNG